MRSTRLADLFYQLDVNPFYPVAIGLFVYPIVVFLLSLLLFRLSYLISLVLTIVIFGCSALVFYLWFHRNPDRRIKSDKKVILSPADGMIVYIRRIKDNKTIISKKKDNKIVLSELTNLKDFSCKNGYIIGVEMRLFDVHINRAPISGDIITDHHTNGRIVSMGNPRFEYINDRNTMVIKSEDEFTVAVVQIASFLARTIKNMVKKNDSIRQGDVFGMIRFGSQVDVVIRSADVNILVKTGDRVYAGVSGLAERMDV